MRGSLTGINFSVLLATIGYGISFPLLSISMEQEGLSGELIGINAAMPALGWIIGTLLLPKLQFRYHFRSILLCLLSLAALAMLAFGTVTGYWTWLILRFVFGGAIGLFFRVIEFWINQTSNDAIRGRNFGTYSVTFMLGIAVGSSIQPSLGTNQFLPYGIIIGFIVSAGLVLLPQNFIDGFPKKQQGTLIRWSVLIASPIAFLGVLAYGLFEDIPTYLMSVYALRNDLGEDVAAFTLTAVAIGNLLFPIPLGILSDRMNRFSLLFLCAFITIVLSLVIPATTNNPAAFLIILAFWGGLAGGIYNICLSIIGDRSKGNSLVIMNASFGIVYAVGALVGPLINGVAIDTLNSFGLIISICLIFGVFIILSIFFLNREKQYG